MLWANCGAQVPHSKGVPVYIIEPGHEISNNVVYTTSNGSDQPVHMRSLIRAFACRLNIDYKLGATKTNFRSKWDPGRIGSHPCFLFLLFSFSHHILVGMVKLKKIQMQKV